MKNYSLLISCFFSLIIFISTGALGHSIDKQDISQFEIPKTNKNLKKIFESFELIKVKDNSFEIYIPTYKTKEFLSMAPNAKLLMKDIYVEEKLSNKEFSDSRKNYKNYDEVITIMRELAKKYPSLAHIQSYGKSAKGNELLYLKISDNVRADESEPELLITAATHGDELITTEALIRTIVEILENKDTNQRLARLINNHELFFIPIVNPDGFKKQRRYTADGTDPNREYPYPEQPNKKSVQCIKKLIEFFNSRDFAGSMDLHASGEMIMYPWGYTKDEVPAADLALFKSLGHKMAKENKYKVGQISKIIYVAPASSADYYYWKKGSVSYGIELARSKAPRWSFDSVIKDTKPMIYTFIESF